MSSLENEIQIFDNEQFGSIRTVMIDGEPWLVGSDVAKALGYKKPQNALLKHVESEDKTTAPIQGTGSNYITQAIIINESGMYSLIMSSKLPSAKEFKRWVTSEVLPEIRKTGSYGKNGLYRQDGSLDIDIVLELALTAKELEESNKEKDVIIAIQEQQLAEQKPKVTYYDIVLSSKGAVLISVIAKDYGMSGQALNDKLHEMGIQYKRRGTWLLYQNYADKGYTETNTHIFKRKDKSTGTQIQTLWTQKGRLFIYEQLKKRGILPLVERDGELC